MLMQLIALLLGPLTALIMILLQLMELTFSLISDFVVVFKSIIDRLSLLDGHLKNKNKPPE